MPRILSLEVRYDRTGRSMNNKDQTVRMGKGIRHRRFCAVGSLTLRFLIQFMSQDGNALVSVKLLLLYPLNRDYPSEIMLCSFRCRHS